MHNKLSISCSYVVDKNLELKMVTWLQFILIRVTKVLLIPFHKDLRRARAAAHNIIPTSTGAAKAVGLVLPHLKGKLDGTAIRVPTPNVSLVDFKFNTKNPISVAALNAKFEEYANGSLKGILGVDSDPKFPVIIIMTLEVLFRFNRNNCYSDTFGRILTWYDNEWGFSNRMLETSQQVCKL